MKNKNKSDRFHTLKNELKDYSKRGVLLSLHGEPSRPYDIAKACRVSESGSTYMRDYISDDNGIIKAIDFRYIMPKQ